MKKKVVALLLAMVTGATLCVGCGNTAATDESTNVSTEVASEISTEELPKEEASEEPTEEPVTEVNTVTPVVVQTTLFAQKTANVRQTPDTNGAIIGKLSVNDPVIVNGDISADGWYTVTYCDQTAYVKGELLGITQVEVTSNTGNGKTSSGKSNITTNSNTSSTSKTTSNNTASGQATQNNGQQAPQPAQNSGQTAQPVQPTQDNGQETQSSQDNGQVALPTQPTTPPAQDLGPSYVAPGAEPAPTTIVVKPEDIM